MTTTLYLCRGCTILLGTPHPADTHPHGVCANCGHEGPHIPGQFEDADAQVLLEGGESG